MKWKNLNNGYERKIDALKKMDPYELLGVTHGISKRELKRHYYDMLKIYHPDKSDDFMKNYGDEYTKLLNIAFEKIVSDFVDE